MGALQILWILFGSRQPASSALTPLFRAKEVARTTGFVVRVSSPTINANLIDPTKNRRPQPRRSALPRRMGRWACPRFRLTRDGKG